MEFVYYCHARKRSVAVAYLNALREYQSGKVHTITNNRMWQCNLSLSFGFKLTSEHLEALNLIKASFFPPPLFVQPLSFRGGTPAGLITLHPYAASQKVWKPISPWLNPLMMRISDLSTKQRKSSRNLTAPPAGEKENKTVYRCTRI